MRRLLLLTLLTPLLGLTGVVTAPAHALPCEQEPKSLATELRTASLVFEGKILRVDERAGEAAYEVKVVRVYRGDGLVERVTVYAPATKGDCGLTGVEKGQNWMFLSGSAPERIVTRSHDGSQEATGKVVREVEATLGPGVKPSTEPEPPVTATLTDVAEDGPETFWPLSLPGFLLVGVGLVVLAAARGLSRRADRH